MPELNLHGLTDDFLVVPINIRLETVSDLQQFRTILDRAMNTWEPNKQNSVVKVLDTQINSYVNRYQVSL